MTDNGSDSRITFTNIIKRGLGNLRADFENWLRSREIFTKQRTICYAALIVITLYVIGIIGYNLAMSSASFKTIYLFLS